jgi:hypothetical protein
MLSVLLSSVTNFAIGQHPHIIRLIKGVFNSKPFKVKGVGMIRVNFGPFSETVYIDIILNTVIKR